MNPNRVTKENAVLPPVDSVADSLEEILSAVTLESNNEAAMGCPDRDLNNPNVGGSNGWPPGTSRLSSVNTVS